jgi:electron transfer flavoprotein alpha subunit
MSIVPTPGRVRRDSRTERRRAPSGTGSGVPDESPEPIDASPVPPLTENDLAGATVFVGGENPSDDWLGIGFARQLAGPDHPVLAISKLRPTELGPAGASACGRWIDAGAEQLAETLAALIRRLDARHVVAHDVGRAAHLLRLVAARLGEGPAAGVVACEEGGLVRRIHTSTGVAEVAVPPTRFVLLAAAAGVAYRGPPVRCRQAEISGTPLEVACRVFDAGLEPVEPLTAPLQDASVVLAGGAGVGDWPSLERLARRLDAALGASRVACDQGQVPRSRQVGASGTSCRAELYLAFGISGANQHLQGLDACDTVVAVNRDERAPIGARADLLVVADADATIRALLDATAEVA